MVDTPQTQARLAAEHLLSQLDSVADSVSKHWTRVEASLAAELPLVLREKIGLEEQMAHLRTKINVTAEVFESAERFLVAETRRLERFQTDRG